MTASKRQAPARSRKPSGGGDPLAAPVRLRVRRGAVVRQDGRSYREGTEFTTTAAEAASLVAVTEAATLADDDALHAAWVATNRSKRRGKTPPPPLPDGLHVVPDEDDEPSLARQFLRP